MILGLMTNTVMNLMKTRVKAIAGDVALIRLGLTEEDYLFLTYEVDAVIHAAAYVNLIYPYQVITCWCSGRAALNLQWRQWKKNRNVL